MPCSNNSAIGSLPVPRFARMARAMRLAARFNAAYVNERSPALTASRCGYSWTILSKRSGIDCSISSFLNSTNTSVGWKHFACMLSFSGGRSLRIEWSFMSSSSSNFLCVELTRFADPAMFCLLWTPNGAPHTDSLCSSCAGEFGLRSPLKSVGDL